MIKKLMKSLLLVYIVFLLDFGNSLYRITSHSMYEEDFLTLLISSLFLCFFNQNRSGMIISLLSDLNAIE
jgi:hypothetical protein